MNELTKKQKEVRRILKEEYNVIVNGNWFKRYVFMYAKLTPLTDVTMNEAIDIILRKPETFVYFIYGSRANYVEDKIKKKIADLK